MKASRESRKGRRSSKNGNSTHLVNGTEQSATAPAPESMAPVVEQAPEVQTANAVTESIEALQPTPRIELMEPPAEVVRAKAYEIFMRRGGGHGHDLEDWLVAERELRAAKY